jgi:hypothetical protein
MCGKQGIFVLLGDFLLKKAYLFLEKLFNVPPPNSTLLPIRLSASSPQNLFRLSLSIMAKSSAFTKLFPLLWELPASLQTLIILGNEGLMSIPMDFYDNSFLKVQTSN